MQLLIKGKNLEVSDSIRDYAEHKLAKLSRLTHPATRVELELAVEKNPSVAAHEIAEATVWLKGRTLRCKKAARDMKAAIDEVTDKLQRELTELRDKRVTKRREAVDPAAGGDLPA
jgi:putative sigma-54 modulation protein